MDYWPKSRTGRELGSFAMRISGRLNTFADLEITLHEFITIAL
jgi:hypothetical protein